MPMFTLAISCLTTFNLPCFMDLTFQVPMQYCSLHHQTLLPSPVTSTTVEVLCCLCFGSVCSFFLELILHWSPVAYWVPTDLGSSSFSILSFIFFIMFMEFSRQEHWSGLPFPSPVDHILSELFTMTHLSWVVLHSMVHSFIEIDKAVVHEIRLVSFLWLWFSVCLPSDGEDKQLLEASWWERPQACTTSVTYCKSRCHLRFWLISYSLKFPTIPSTSSINFLEQFIELRKTIYWLFPSFYKKTCIRIQMNIRIEEMQRAQYVGKESRGPVPSPGTPLSRHHHVYNPETLWTSPILWRF